MLFVFFTVSGFPSFFLSEASGNVNVCSITNDCYSIVAPSWPLPYAIVLSMVAEDRGQA